AKYLGKKESISSFSTKMGLAAMTSLLAFRCLRGVGGVGIGVVGVRGRPWEASVTFIPTLGAGTVVDGHASQQPHEDYLREHCINQFVLRSLHGSEIGIGCTPLAAEGHRPKGNEKGRAIDAASALNKRMQEKWDSDGAVLQSGLIQRPSSGSLEKRIGSQRGFGTSGVSGGRTKKSSEKGVIQIPEERLDISFTRSSGAGGQNVNKVNTKVAIRFSIADADWLAPDIRERLAKQQASRVNKNGELVIVCQEHRPVAPSKSTQLPFPVLQKSDGWTCHVTVFFSSSSRFDISRLRANGNLFVCLSPTSSLFCA
ncbi:unnamed protein product, partial [Discosporangium mesarthrocarpum]